MSCYFTPTFRLMKLGDAGVLSFVTMLRDPVQFDIDIGFNTGTSELLPSLFTAYSLV